MHGEGDNANLQPERPTVRPFVGVLWGLAVAGVAALWAVDPAEVHLPLCSFYAWTGMHCPGCGATRAAHALLHGRWIEALRDNVLFVVLLPLAGALALGEVWRRRTGRRARYDLLRNRWFYGALITVAVVFFVLRNLPGWPWELLRPLP